MKQAIKIQTRVISFQSEQIFLANTAHPTLDVFMGCTMPINPREKKFQLVGNKESCSTKCPA
jgi:hypothetical protein